MDRPIITPGSDVPEGGPELADTIPPDAAPEVAAVAACFRCVTDLGSVHQLRDIIRCKSKGCAVWPSRQKFVSTVRQAKRKRK